MTAIPKPEHRPKKPRKRPRRQRKSTPAQLARKADKLWGHIVRKDICEAFAIGPKCSGPLQAAHGISRRYRHTRWLPINGFSLCAAHHFYYTNRPLEWEDYLRESWGATVYNQLRLIALRPFAVDVGTALESLREEVKARGIEA